MSIIEVKRIEKDVDYIQHFKCKAIIHQKEFDFIVIREQSALYFEYRVEGLDSKYHNIMIEMFKAFEKTLS